MYVLTRMELDCEGYFNVPVAVCVSESKDLLTEYHKKNEGNCLIGENDDFRNWCKKNNVDYYRHSTYCFIEEITFLS